MTGRHVRARRARRFGARTQVRTCVLAPNLRTRRRLHAFTELGMSEHHPTAARSHPPRARRRRRPLAEAPTRADESADTPGSVPGRFPAARWAAIHLRRALPTRLQRPTRELGRAALKRSVPCLTLLQVGFTEPPGRPGTLVVSYTTVSPLPRLAEASRGGLLSVALSRGSPRVGVTHHLALRSPDVPRREHAPDAAAWPTHPRRSG